MDVRGGEVLAGRGGGGGGGGRWGRFAWGVWVGDISAATVISMACGF